MTTTPSAEVDADAYDHMRRISIRQFIALMRAVSYLRGIVAHGDELWKVHGREIVADLERLGLYDDPTT